VRQRKLLLDAVASILDAFARGDHPGARLDDDGLIAAGTAGSALTWMDARIDGRPVTPRVGKPVEIQALWLNALRLAADVWPRWDEVYLHGLASFRERFWDDDAGYLADLVDVDHVPGTRDMTFRPNQLLAVGGLPFMLLDDGRGRRLVRQVEERLWTGGGVRTLDPASPDYQGRAAGDARARALACHQGTVWTWLVGPFFEAWVRVSGGTASVRAEARARFLHPLLRHLDEAGLGHLGDRADGDPPHAPCGAFGSAWAVAEALRIERGVLADPIKGRRRSKARAASIPEPAGPAMAEATP
jgi:glycogen debranching enzyme